MPKRRSLKRGLIALVALLAVGFVGLNWVAYRQAYAMMHFTRGSQRTEQPEALSPLEKARVPLWTVDGGGRGASSGSG